MISIVRFLLISFYLLFAWPCFAEVTADQFQWKVLTNRSEIEGLVLLNQEKTLWISTNGGLEQRDGHSGELIRVFTHVSTLPVSDGRGGEWGINRLGNLVHLSQDGEWQIYDYENSPLSGSPISSLVSEEATSQSVPTLWIGTRQGVVRARSTLSTQPWQVEWKHFGQSNSPLSNDIVRVLVGDGQGGVWLETEQGDYIHVTNDERWIIQDTTQPYLPDSPIHFGFFSSDGQGGLWLYGKAFDSKPSSFLHFNYDGNLTTYESVYGADAFTSDGQGGIWTRSGHSFVSHLSKQGEWTPYTAPNQDNAHSYGVLSFVSSIQENGLWVGTFNNLHYLTPEGTWQIDRMIGPSGTEWLGASVLAPDSQGGIWIGTNRHGLVHLKNNGELQKFSPGLPDTQFFHFSSDGKGGVWLASSTGIAHLDQNDEWMLIHSEDFNLDPNAIEQLVDDGQGGACAIGVSLAIHITANQEIRKFDSREELPHACLENLSQPTSKLIINDGREGIWQVTYNGLIHQDSQGHSTLFDRTNSSLPCNRVNVLLDDGEGGVWIGCGEKEEHQGGLGHVSKAGQWLVFTSSYSELPSNYIQDLISDGLGGLWIKTFDGANNRLAHLSVRQPVVDLPTLGVSVASSSSFTGGSSVNGQAYQTQITVTPSDTLIVKGEVAVDPNHVGLQVDLVVYAQVLHGQDSFWVMLDKQGELQMWDQQTDHLVASKEHIVLQAQQSFSLYQGNLATPLGMRKLFFGYRLPNGEIISNPTEILIQVSLPALGNAVDLSPHHMPTTTSFFGGISLNDQPYHTQVIQNLTDHVQIRGEIAVDPTHVGQVADIIVYVETGFPLSSTPTYFMLDGGLSILPWDQQSHHLVPFMRQVTLEPFQQISIYQGNFYAPGHLNVFFGYRLADGTTAVNTRPIDISVLK